jgi:hypothetical protein
VTTPISHLAFFLLKAGRVQIAERSFPFGVSRAAELKRPLILSLAFISPRLEIEWSSSDAIHRSPVNGKKVERDLQLSSTVEQYLWVSSLCPGPAFR